VILHANWPAHVPVPASAKGYESDARQARDGDPKRPKPVQSAAVFPGFFLFHHVGHHNSHLLSD
jgi:hypothetical protein